MMMRKRALVPLAAFLALALVLAVPLPAGQSADAAVTPQALLVLAFAPGESLRSSCVSDLQETVRTLWEFGFEVEILDAYSESGGIIPYPHHQLHQRLDGKRFNLLVYYGHGDANRWAFHLPQDTAWAAQTGTPQGWDEARMFGDYRNHWAEEIRLAPDAMVVMRHTCFSNGIEAGDLSSAAGLLSQGEVLRRINEYSYTFLNPATATGSYTATAIVGGTPAYLRNLIKHYCLIYT
jgi:hypothetical protein